MAFSSGFKNICLEDILNKVSEADIAYYYLNILEIPTVISSPVRSDNHPSLGLYSIDGKRIHYVDFATKDKGGLFDLLGLMWGCSYMKVLSKIYNDIPNFKNSKSDIKSSSKCLIKKSSDIRTELQCKIRDWKDYDIEYWKSFGITLEWLKYAEVYPVSHKIVIKGDYKNIFVADKYAYAYVEHKEGKVTLKIYQPFNKKGYKWSNKHDKSVISLWTKVPKYGEHICICSSLKDALCLWANTGIPSLAIQGEGYSISNTAINNLKSRYKNIYICLDNDTTGLIDGEKLSKETGFINIVLPSFEGGKDISDLYKSLNNKDAFKTLILKLFNL